METLYYFLSNYPTFTISGSLVFILLISFYIRYRRKKKIHRYSQSDLYSDDYLPDEPQTNNAIIENKSESSTINDVETNSFIPSLEEVVSTSSSSSSKPLPEEETLYQFGKIEGNQLIIVLYIVAQRGRGLNGSDIFSALEEIGLKYGDMNIFHHYGVGELKVKQAVFSVANIVEPGTFDLREMDEFTTPGLALFLRLPGPFGGRVAFELMLNSAQRMAEELRGVLQDERHQFLTQKAITALRERIAQFEHRG
jgi:cell division protein ZipA